MRVALPFLVALLLVVTSAASSTLGIAPTADDQIVPGVRIGKWTVKMTIDDLVRMNGPARINAYSPPPPFSSDDSDLVREPTTFEWSEILAATFDRHRIVSLHVNEILPMYRTDKGIGFQSIRGDVIRLYGKTTAQTTPKYGQTNLIYDKIGVTFRSYDGGGRIFAIAIFRPGTAKSIWKF